MGAVCNSLILSHTHFSIPTFTHLVNNIQGIITETSTAYVKVASFNTLTEAI